ncbi:MAG: rod shape-determining protein MreD [Clostridia bacterium]|nr:rod shape-determining protein MreD [Clostridia bacterium]
MRYIIYLIVSTLIFIFQSTLCQYIAIAGIKPNLMLILVVSLAFLRGNSEGLFTGIIMGLLQDCYFGQSIGSNLFLYAITGYAVGCISEHFNKDNVVAPVFLTFMATLFYNSGFYMLNIILKGYTTLSIYIVLNILPELIYNIIFAFIIYFIVYTINNSSFGKTGHKYKF